MRFEPHHALATQRAQGFAHRRDADAEFGGGLVEPDEGARPQRARHDANPQVRGNLVGELLAMNPLGGCVHGPVRPPSVLSHVLSLTWLCSYVWRGVVPGRPRPYCDRGNTMFDQISTPRNLRRDQGSISR